MPGLILAGLLIIATLIYLGCRFGNPHSIYEWWNRQIDAQCRKQNDIDRAFRHIPSVQNAWLCQNYLIQRAHRHIAIMHDRIIAQMDTYFETMVQCAIDSRDGPTGHPDCRYFPLIIDSTPTSLMTACHLDLQIDSVIRLGILVIEPGTTTDWSHEVSRGYYRYHYGLKLPMEGGFGLLLRPVHPDSSSSDNRSQRLQWKERQGFIWDPTIPHQLTNPGSTLVIIIVADIPRLLGSMYSMINRLLHTYAPVESKFL